ncbi:hypothetical protein Syun_004977 [Stephania yunnanensis]|uniref:Uncharacterized protein n=1 Tax=Stephania yunnanensis TaxID=152371 RepID=A0AAP0L4X9_9MAGN
MNNSVHATYSCLKFDPWSRTMSLVDGYNEEWRSCRPPQEVVVIVAKLAA